MEDLDINLHTTGHLNFDKAARNIEKKTASSTNDASHTGWLHVEEGK